MGRSQSRIGMYCLASTGIDMDLNRAGISICKLGCLPRCIKVTPGNRKRTGVLKSKIDDALPKVELVGKRFTIKLVQTNDEHCLRVGNDNANRGYLHIFTI